MIRLTRCWLTGMKQLNPGTRMMTLLSMVRTEAMKDGKYLLETELLLTSLSEIRLQMTNGAFQRWLIPSLCLSETSMIEAMDALSCLDTFERLRHRCSVIPKDQRMELGDNDAEIDQSFIHEELTHQLSKGLDALAGASFVATISDSSQLVKLLFLSSKFGCLNSSFVACVCEQPLTVTSQVSLLLFLLPMKVFWPHVTTLIHTLNTHAAKLSSQEALLVLSVVAELTSEDELTTVPLQLIQSLKHSTHASTQSSVTNSTLPLDALLRCVRYLSMDHQLCESNKTTPLAHVSVFRTLLVELRHSLQQIEDLLQQHEHIGMVASELLQLLRLTLPKEGILRGGMMTDVLDRLLLISLSTTLLGTTRSAAQRVSLACQTIANIADLYKAGYFKRQSSSEKQWNRFGSSRILSTVGHSVDLSRSVEEMCIAAHHPRSSLSIKALTSMLSDVIMAEAFGSLPSIESDMVRNGLRELDLLTPALDTCLR